MFRSWLAAGVGLLATSAVALAETPQSGGTLNLVIQPEPPSLMLPVVQNGPTQMVAGNIYESLFRYDTDLNPIPNLATGFEVNDDGTVYTFTLKEGVVWHDGAPFTAADVVFTADVFLRETHPRFRVSLAHVETIEALDDHTVRFTLKQPFGPFMGIFEVGTMPLVPKHIYEGVEDFRNAAENNTPIGTGPFKYEEWVRGSHIRLVKNEDYHVAGQPYLDEAYWHVIPDAASRVVAYETGTVDVLPGGAVDVFDVQRLIARDDTDYTTQGWEYFGPHQWLWINNREAPMDDARFRQALMYAIDREFLRDVVWNQLGEVATGPVSSSTKFYSDDVKAYPHDPDRARALLDEMGYDGAPIRLLPLPYGETWQRAAEAVRQNLIDVGIEVRMEATDVAGWNQRLNEWDFDLAFTYLYQYGDPALGVARTYISTNIAKGSPWNNVAGYENADVDRLFADAAVAFPAEARQELYDEVQQILVEQVPVAWLLEMTFPTIYRDTVHGLVDTAIGVNDGLVDAWIEQ